MNTKLLSNRALSVIDQYINFRLGQAVCSIPYFNNKTIRARGSLRTFIGKGSPRDIEEEVETILHSEKIDPGSLTSEALKKLLVDRDLGIDCSGFAYYVLNAECIENSLGSLERHIKFVNSTGILGKIRSMMRPVENCSVSTLADNANSYEVSTKEVRPGDIITMLGGPDRNDRDHILVIHQVEYQNFIPYKIHYSHAVAYPSDGIYGSGARQGEIEIKDSDKSILAGKWVEKDKSGIENQIFNRATKSRTELRRLRSFRYIK